MEIPAALAFVDLETTGTNPLTDRITEIGMVLMDGEQEESWSSLVNPGVEISPFIEQLTGISNAMVATAPTFAELADPLFARLQGRLFIAHNARFDYGFLKQEFARSGLRFQADTLCTVKLSRQLFPEHQKHNLDALMQRHGLTAPCRHRALADASLIHQFWQTLQAEPGPAAIAAAMKNQISQTRLPPHLEARAVEALPEAAGVYSFFGTDDQALHVGRAKNLRKQVFSHFTSPRNLRMHQEIRRLDWQECPGDIGARLLEDRLVKTLQPLHNRPRKSSSVLLTWRLDDLGEGRLKPCLVEAHAQDFTLDTPCYGLFKSPREALEILRALATEQGLCDTLLGLEQTAPGKPCCGITAKRCKGACIGRETPAQHSMRLIGALIRHKLQPWPYNGPALLREGDEAHLVDAWRYLGSIRDTSDLPSLLNTSRPAFDQDIYRLLVRQLGRFEPLKHPRAWADASVPR
ncbi:MAG: exonuclease domain-containing protein [Azovibrio sp.]|uniref:3'-5' exonuclease family protein n=1 Tax=Azovibrio sp. TaxID=1872673 RepID=UPI003C759DEF